MGRCHAYHAAARFGLTALLWGNFDCQVRGDFLTAPPDLTPACRMHEKNYKLTARRQSRPLSIEPLFNSSNFHSVPQITHRGRTFRNGWLCSVQRTPQCPPLHGANCLSTAVSSEASAAKYEARPEHCYPYALSARIRNIRSADYYRRLLRPIPRKCSADGRAHRQAPRIARRICTWRTAKGERKAHTEGQNASERVRFGLLRCSNQN